MVYFGDSRDLDLVGHALLTGLKDLERASVHIQRASEDLEKGPPGIQHSQYDVVTLRQTRTAFDS